MWVNGSTNPISQVAHPVRYRVYDLSVLRADIQGHKPGTKTSPGSAVPERSEDDPAELIVSVNEDNDDGGPAGQKDNRDTTISANDNDIVQITLKRLLPASVTEGTLELTVTPASALRVFNPSGTALLSDYSVDLASPVGDLVGLVSGDVSIFVEGINYQEDVMLRLAYKDTTGTEFCYDEVHLHVINPTLIPDYNHDRAINTLDENQATPSTPFRFWINDDDDDGDISDGNNDLPGQSGGNYVNNQVDGRSDLLDFFPVWFDFHETLTILPPGSGIEYKLRQDDGALRFVYTDLTKDQAGAFLTTELQTYGPVFTSYAHEAFTRQLSSIGIDLTPFFLNKIVINPNKGALLIEGVGPSSSVAPLILEVWENGSKVSETELSLSISGVEDMFTHVNLVDDLDQPEQQVVTVPDRFTRVGQEPSNLPDSLNKGDNFVFVHGYNVDQTAARGWHAEIFKRLYQSGSRAKFTGVTWHGNTGGNYHKAVINKLLYHICKV